VRVLGLDLSKTSCGFAVWGPEDARAHSGTWELGSAYTPRGKVYAKLHQNMTDLHRMGPIDCIFYEEALNPAVLQGHTNIDSLRVLNGLVAHAESWGEAMGCRVIHPVNQSTWRRWFIGKMPAATRTAELKDYAMRRARQLGFHPTKHDQAEAIGIMDFGCEQMNLSPPWRVQRGLLAPLVATR
jgi:hypothetical protein